MMTAAQAQKLPDRSAKITKRVVDAARKEADRYLLWDTDLKGFGLRVEPSGKKSYLVRYRVTGGASRSQRQLTLGRHGPLTPDEARERARQALAAASAGADPLANRSAAQDALTLQEVADRFLTEHAEKKKKPRTAAFYRWILEKYVLAEWGARKAVLLTESDVAALHSKMSKTPYVANRVIAVLAALYAWAGRRKLVPLTINPARGIDKYTEAHRERFLTREELDRLGTALRLGETSGFEREKRADKRAPKADVRDVLPLYAAAAIRLLLFTGARLGEILTLQWAHVDTERQCLLLPESKTGAKIIVLNPPALAVLASLPRVKSNPYVIVGNKPGECLADIKRPWRAVCEQAKLTGVRLHDLRHTFASYGAAANMGLPVIGKLLGHSQASTTARYSHLADDPLRRASQSIANTISSAMGDPEVETAEVIPLRR